MNAAVLNILIQANGVVKAQQQIRGVHGDLEKADKTAGKARSTFSKVAGGAAAIGGLAALTGGVRSAIGEFEEARKVSAQTRAVIKSTGGVANVTAKDVDTLTSAISRKVGIDDEAIAKGANLLLTFKNVRNEAGKGRDVFNQATQAAVDLSAAGFGSLESTSKQLGKALNDPVKGMTALSRSGVTFSEDQKKAIEALMETGKASDRVRAQQLILKEVQSQVGGSAAAQATTMDRLKVMLGNAAETAGAVLVPALDRVGRVLLNVGSTVRAVTGFFREHETLTTVVATTLGVLTAGYIGFTAAVKIGAAWTAAVTTATAAWNAVLAANPIVLVVAALAALAAGLVIAYKKSETFRNIVDGAFNAIKTVASAVFGWLREAVKNIAGFLAARWENVKSVLTTYWNGYRTIIIDPIRAAFGWVREAVGKVIEFLGNRWENLKEIFSRYFEAYRQLIIEPLSKAFGWVREKVGDLANVFTGAFDRMKDAVRPVVDLVKDLVGAVKDAVSWIGKIKIPKISLPFGIGDPRPGEGGAGLFPPMIGGTGTLGKAHGIAKRFGLAVTSGYRTPAQNAAAGGVPGSLHTHGTPTNPGAVDLVGPVGNMYAALAWARGHLRLMEGLVHDVGSGLHLHLGFFKRGGVSPGGLAIVGEEGPELAHLPRGTRVYPAHQTQQMLAGAGTGNITVNVYQDTLVPYSPQQAHALGQEVVRAISFQGGGSSRATVSLSGRPKGR